MGLPRPAPRQAARPRLAVVYRRVVGIYPAESTAVRLVGPVLLDANDEWVIQRRYMQVEGMAELGPPLIDGDAAPADDPRFTLRARLKRVTGHKE